MHLTARTSASLQLAALHSRNALAHPAGARAKLFDGHSVHPHVLVIKRPPPAQILVAVMHQFRMKSAKLFLFTSSNAIFAQKRGWPLRCVRHLSVCCSRPTDCQPGIISQIRMSLLFIQTVRGCAIAGFVDYPISGLSNKTSLVQYC